MKLIDIYENQVPRFVIHETSVRAAIAILQYGAIKGIYVENPQAEKDLSDDLGPDYGKFVYATAYNDGQDICYGVEHPDVTFVINVSKLIKPGTYDPDYEGGLYMIEDRVQLKAIDMVIIKVDRDITGIAQLKSLCNSKRVNVQITTCEQYMSIVQKYQ